MRNTMKTSSLLMLLVSITACGCQAWHKSSPTAHKPAATQSDLALAPETTPATPPTLTPPEPRAVVIAPATTPASTTPAAMPKRNYVAADADEATRLRNWPVSINGYPSGRVIAGPVYRINAPPPRSDRWDDVVAEDLFQTALTPIQMLATPFWAIFTPPYTAVEYHGETFPPSYTADNPLPYYENEQVKGIVQMKR
jgi:hypothetical protein